jgi:hypothetical protein
MEVQDPTMVAWRVVHACIVRSWVGQRRSNVGEVWQVHHLDNVRKGRNLSGNFQVLAFCPAGAALTRKPQCFSKPIESASGSQSS